MFFLDLRQDEQLRGLPMKEHQVQREKMAPFPSGVSRGRETGVSTQLDMPRPPFGWVDRRFGHSTRIRLIHVSTLPVVAPPLPSRSPLCTGRPSLAHRSKFPVASRAAPRTHDSASNRPPP